MYRLQKIDRPRWKKLGERDEKISKTCTKKRSGSNNSNRRRVELPANDNRFTVGRKLGKKGNSKQQQNNTIRK